MSGGYLNKVEMKDGQIVLYHRTANSKRPIYHMRIHVRGMRDIHGKKLTYWKSTTNESDLEEAKRVALNKFDELRMLAKDNRPVIEISFSDLYALWWKEKKIKLEATFAAKGRTGQTERVGWYEKQSRRYWLAYFGNKKIGEINQAYVNGYWTWRIAYWAMASEAEKKAYPNYALKPSKKTLDMEQSALREIFGWGNANKVITYQPIIQNPYARQGIGAKRRASFDESDWQRLREYMRLWVRGKGINDKRVNSKHLYQRKLLQIYLHWLALTGMRTGEVLKLRHRDVQIGHVAALHSHRPNRYFCKLDIENFFYSIGRNRVARCLRSISVKRSAQYAKWSCVKNPFQKPSYALPYGFVQSTSLATLALSQSALGSALRKAASHCNVAVYVDDITLSSNSITTLNDIFEELVPAFNEADLQENKQKRIQPCEKMSVFNCSLTQNSTHVELDRIAEFHQCNQAPASVEGFERYCRSVMKGNQ